MPRQPAEIKAWSDEMEASSPMKNPDKSAYRLGQW
jgi:hypothetical protein